MSARRPDDVMRLHGTIVTFFPDGEFFLPWSVQQLRQAVFANCLVLEERADEAGAYFHVRTEADVLEKLRAQIGEGGAAPPPKTCAFRGWRWRGL